MKKKTLTAPLAIIKVKGVAIGRMKSIQVTETIRRGAVRGIGELTPQELAALEWSGNLTCAFFTVDFKRTSMIPGSIVRIASLSDFIDTVLLQEDGVDIDIMKKIAQGPANATTGIIKGKYEVFGTIRGAFTDRQSFDISDGQISGTNQDFSYLNPILFKDA